MMCEEPAAAEPAPVVEAATPEPPPMTNWFDAEEHADRTVVLEARCEPCQHRLEPGILGKYVAQLHTIALLSSLGTCVKLCVFLPLFGLVHVFLA